MWTYARPKRWNFKWNIYHHVVCIGKTKCTNWIAGFQCHTIIKTIQQIKSRIKEVKEDEYSNSLAKTQVSAMFGAGDIGRNVLLKIYKAMYGDAMFVSLWGAQIWWPEANKNICHRVWYNKSAVVFWGLMNICMSTYSHTRTVQIAGKSPFVTHVTAFSATIL